MTREPLSRRRLLRTVAPATVAGLAGCSLGSTDTPSTPTDVPPARVAEWIADAAVPLEATDPSAPLEPLEPLADAFADATIVGLGESTHGSRELFRVKHRLVRFLVEQLDYRVVALEANFSEALAIDEYVRHGEGNPAAALADLHYWAWNAREILSLIEWLRSFNEGRDPGDRVRFYGFDAQYATDPARRLLSYLETVDAATHDEVAPDLTLLAEQGFDDDGETPLADRLETAETLVADLREAFEQHREAYVEASSEDGYRVARRHLWTLARAREFEAADRDESSAIRDRAMAANVGWLLEHENPEGVALWGHNAHVGTSTDVRTVDPMGKHLRAEHGDAYCALAFEFARGSFRARSMADGELTEFTVDAPPEGTFPAVLAAAERPPLWLGFESVENTELAGWLDQSRSIHGIGTVFDASWTWSRYTERVDLPGAFDGVVFVGDSTPTRPVTDGSPTRASEDDPPTATGTGESG